VKIARALVIAALLHWSADAIGAPAGTQQFFPYEQQAQQHCPADIIVWVNPQSGHYHFKGQRYYANTKQGSFACMREADKAGYRATRVGQ
jgi:hypothetical protein